MGLQPLGNRIVIEMIEETERVEGGIVLPESALSQPSEGTVIEVGPGELLDDGSRGEMPVNVGDIVVFSRYGGTDVTIAGQDLKILSIDDVLAVRE